jgi:hypothetical protein
MNAWGGSDVLSGGVEESGRELSMSWKEDGVMVLHTGRSVDPSHAVGCRKVRVNGCNQRWRPVTTGKRRSLMAMMT